MPKLKIRGRLSFVEAKHLFQQRRFKAHDYKSVHSSSSYRIYQRGDAYALKMYNTDVLVYYPDGSIYIDGYDSMTTTQVLSDYGPVNVWSNSKLRYVCKHRFGLRWQTDGYPLVDGVTIDPNGYVHGLVDKIRIIDPSTRAARTQLAREFRFKATPRIVLGEFKQLATKTAEGWQAAVPDNAAIVADLFISEADHAAFVDHFREHRMRTMRVGLERWSEPRIYTTEMNAYKAVISSLQRALLAVDTKYVYKEIKYDSVKVR